MRASPLSVGVQLPEVEREVRWPELRGIAAAAEDCGFDSIWLGDHMLYRDDGRPERAKRLLENAEKYCVVLNTLRSGVPVESTKGEWGLGQHEPQGL